MNIEELAAEHVDDFPGYQLVDFYDAALPSYAIQLKVLMQVRRPLPAIEEYVLKAIDTGQETAAEVAGLLGLEWSIVQSGLDNLHRRGYVSFAAPRETNGREVRILITPKGRVTLRDLLLAEPEPDNFAMCMDALTGKPYLWRPLRQPRDIRELEFHEIPTFVPTPKLEDLDFMALKRLVSESQRELPDRTERRELVDVLEIEKHWTGYRIMRILQCVRPEDGALQVEVFDGIERSPEHETALLQMEALKYRPLRAVTQKEVPLADSEEMLVFSPQTIAAAKRKAIELPKLQQEIQQKQTARAEAEAQLGSRLVEERQEASHVVDQLSREITRLQERIQQMEDQSGSTEALQMHEHRPRLIEALKSAKERIIIVSPWLNPQAVDYELRQEIAEALKRGIEIYIGHGFGDPDRREEITVDKLKKIARGKQGRLKLYRLGDVHSKVLICDDSFMVIGSFNWLSFAGDPIRGSRVEDGMLTRDKKAVAQKTQEWLERFKTLEQEPPVSA